MAAAKEGTAKKTLTYQALKIGENRGCDSLRVSFLQSGSTGPKEVVHPSL